MSPLSVAVSRRHFDFALFLVSKGADPMPLLSQVCVHGGDDGRYVCFITIS